MKLSKEVRKNLAIIHGANTREVLYQIEEIFEQKDKYEELQELSTEEYTMLIELLEKYLDMILKII
jgi:hypothetical protein